MELTHDGFLGGRLTIAQPKSGFRSGADAVFLAASVPADAGQSTLELGLGAGVASLCLGARVPGLDLAGVEIQGAYAELARENARANGQEIAVFAGDIGDPPQALKDRSFDHVLMNPPYYRAGAWSGSSDVSRALALGETRDLGEWVDAGTRRLAPGGWLTAILKAPRLVDLIRAMDDRLGNIQIKPIAPRAGRVAELVVVRSQKGARTEPRIFPPLVLHRDAFHRGDTPDPSPEAEAILRHGENLQF